MKEEAIKITESILKSLGKADDPLKPIVEHVIEKALLKANMGGYEEATANHLKTIKKTIT